jgi:thiamine-phosphate pyrophosphorylase
MPVDYIAIGPIFSTATKENPDSVVGLERLAEIKKSISKPLVAIGGITLQSARAVIEAGADSLAIISALYVEQDISGSYRALESSVG